MAKRGRISLKDIAREAGVSTATASVVLSGKNGGVVRVGEETRERILTVAQNLGYMPNPAARSLVGGINHMIAIFTYEGIFPIEQHDFYYPFLLGIEKEAEVYGYDLLLMTSITGEAAQPDRRREGIHRLRLADGCILLGLERDEQEVSELAKSGFPLVTVGKREFPGVQVSYVAGDYQEATSKLIDRAYSKGHRKFAYFRVATDNIPSSDREMGYIAACRRLIGAEGGSYIFRATPEVINSKQIIDLIKNGVSCFIAERFAQANRIAELVEAADLHIPDDLSIMVLGGPKERLSIERDWTSFEVPSQEMGKHAFRILVSLIQDTEGLPIRISLPCRIIEGSTLAELSENMAIREE